MAVCYCLWLLPQVLTVNGWWREGCLGPGLLSIIQNNLKRPHSSRAPHRCGCGPCRDSIAAQLYLHFLGPVDPLENSPIKFLSVSLHLKVFLPGKLTSGNSAGKKSAMGIHRRKIANPALGRGDRTSCLLKMDVL